MAGSAGARSPGSTDGRTRTNLKTVAILIAIFLLVALLWNTFLVTPLKLFVVLLHEVSHGLAAVATGGSIERIEVNVWQGGVCYTRGGIRFVVLTAGYLGSMCWGAALLVLSSRTRLQRWISLGLGLLLLGITLIYVRTWFGFGFSLGCSLFMLLAGWKFPPRVNDFILKLIGLTSCLYAILDIVDDVLRRPGIGSDADMLAQLTFIPGVVWGVLWILASVVVTAASLWVAARGPKRGR